MRNLPFRLDINALRTLAILLVLLFHFDIPGFSSGFVGVDVFFVISGYLMGAIIVRGLETGSFSLLSFYAARARRIIPALAVLCVVLFCFGWFWLAPIEYTLLSEHIAASMTFVSNFVYKGEEGYFDLPSQYKWLLHTWSLSVEWQFYLVYPLILMGAWRLSGGSRKVITVTIASLTTISLVACIIVSPIKATFSFFILPTRLWEMSVGSMLYLFTIHRKNILSRWQSNLVLLSGFIFIVLAAVLFSDDTIWPGHNALLPVCGAVLFIFSQNEHSYIVHHKLVQKIGIWSYSIYLWHWPVVVGAAYFELKTIPFWQVYAIAATFVMGALSYRFIEVPCMRMCKMKRNAVILAGVVCIIVISACAVWYDKGVPSRVSPYLVQIDNEANNTPPIYRHSVCRADPIHKDFSMCAYGDIENIGAIIWGDSHGGALITAVHDALHKGVAYYLGQCPVIFDASFKGKTKRMDCKAFHENFLSYVKTAPSRVPVIVIARLSAPVSGLNEGIHKIWGVDYKNLTPDEQALSLPDIYKKKLVQSLCKIATYRPVYVVKPTPEIGIDVPKTMARLVMIGRNPEITLPLQDYQKRHVVVMSALQDAQKECDIKILDPVPYLCADGKKCVSSYKDRPIYTDDDHISEYGNRLLIPMFKKGIK